MFDIKETPLRVARKLIHQSVHRDQYLLIQAHASLELGALLPEGQITQIHAGRNNPKQVLQSWTAIALLIKILSNTLDTPNGAEYFLRHPESLSLVLEAFADLFGRDLVLGRRFVYFC